MRSVLILSSLALLALSAAPAWACRGQPMPVEKFWSSLPAKIETGEVVLEIQYLGPWKEPAVPGEDRVVVADCDYSGIFHYRVTRVLQGEFKSDEIYVPVYGGLIGEYGNKDVRHIVVGQFASYYSEGGYNAYPPKPRENDRGRPPSVPLFYTRPPA
jgi:hypothetical protein